MSKILLALLLCSSNMWGVCQSCQATNALWGGCESCRGRAADWEDEEDEEYEELPPYRVQIGDVLQVSVYGEQGTERQVMVDRTGSIPYPLVGNIPVYGKTIQEVQELLTEKLSDLFRFAIVMVSPIEYGAQYYTVTGAIAIPGRKPLLGRETVLTALARSGGFEIGPIEDQLVDIADLEKAFLARNERYIPIDFRKLVATGDPQYDEVLQPGDYIYVPTLRTRQVSVIGEVAGPQQMIFHRQITLSEAIARAGGVTTQASSRAVVVRGSLCCPCSYHVDINLIFKGCEPDFPLCPGDIVFVPPQRFSYLKSLAELAVQSFVLFFFRRSADHAWEAISGQLPANDGDFIIFPPLP